jgi:hypothetical protein
MSCEQPGRSRPSVMADERRAADDLRREVRARLSAGRLPFVDGVSKSHRGTGGPCIVCRRAIGPTEVERELDGVGVVLIAHEVCYVLWREESVSHRQSAEHDVKSSSGKARRLHIIAGKIAEIGDGYVLLGFSSAPIQLTDELADGFYAGQRVTITAVLIDGEFIAQKIVLD